MVLDYVSCYKGERSVPHQLYNHNVCDTLDSKRFYIVIILTEWMKKIKLIIHLNAESIQQLSGIYVENSKKLKRAFLKHSYVAKM